MQSSHWPRGSRSWQSVGSAMGTAAARALALLVSGLVVYPLTEIERWRNRRRNWR